MGNLRPAPFFLNERTVGAMLADRPGPAVAYVPFEGALVDRPRQSEDPQFARANDDFPQEPDGDPLIEPAPEHFPSPDWPDSPLPDEQADEPILAVGEPCWRCGAARGCSHREPAQ